MTENDMQARLDELNAKDTLTDDEATELLALADELDEGGPDEDVDQTPTTPAEPEKPKTRRSRRKKVTKDPDPEGARFCLYNASHGRFVGTIRDTREEADADLDRVTKDPQNRYQFEVRTV